MTVISDLWRQIPIQASKVIVMGIVALMSLMMFTTKICLHIHPVLVYYLLALILQRAHTKKCTCNPL